MRNNEVNDSLYFVYGKRIERLIINVIKSIGNVQSDAGRRLKESSRLEVFEKFHGNF